MADDALIFRDEKGRVMPGSNLSSKKRGLHNRITLRIREEFARWYEETGERANPLIILGKITLDSKDEQMQIAAASRLAKFFMPTKIELTSGDEPSLDEESVVNMKRITSTIQRALTEQKLLPAPEAE